MVEETRKNRELILFGIFRKKRRDLDDQERGTLNAWLTDNKLDAEGAMYSVYRDMPFTHSDSAAFVIGVSNPITGGHHEGFCLEIYRGEEVRKGGRIFAGVASRGRQFEMESRARKVPMVSLALRADREHSA